MFYEEVLKAFNQENAEYVVVGGIALNLQGVPRATADLDIVVALEEENLKRIAGVLRVLGYRPRIPMEIDEFTIENLEKWRKEKKMSAFTFWNPKRPYEEVDILIHNPIDFWEMKSDSDVIEAGEVKIPIASIDHLITLKKNSNREQDKSDVAALQKIKRLREK